MTSETGGFVLDRGEDFEAALEVRPPSVFSTPPLLVVDVDRERCTDLPNRRSAF